MSLGDVNAIISPKILFLLWQTTFRIGGYVCKWSVADSIAAFVATQNVLAFKFTGFEKFKCEFVFVFDLIVGMRWTKLLFSKCTME